MNRKAVWQESEFFLEASSLTVCLFRRKAVSIAIHWAGTRVPEFTDVLRRIAQNAASAKNGVCSRDNDGIVSIVRLYPAEKDVAIEEVRRLRHLAGPCKNSRG